MQSLAISDSSALHAPLVVKAAVVVIVALKAAIVTALKSHQKMGAYRVIAAAVAIVLGIAVQMKSMPRMGSLMPTAPKLIL